MKKTPKKTPVTREEAYRLVALTVLLSNLSLIGIAATYVYEIPFRDPQNAAQEALLVIDENGALMNGEIATGDFHLPVDLIVNSIRVADSDGNYPVEAYPGTVQTPILVYWEGQSADERAALRLQFPTGARYRAATDQLISSASAAFLQTNQRVIDGIGLITIEEPEILRSATDTVDLRGYVIVLAGAGEFYLDNQNAIQ